MSLKQQLIKSFFGVGAMRLLVIPVGLITSIVLTRFMTPEEFGKYSFIMALIPLLALPISSGMQNLLTREVAGYSSEKKWPLYNGVVNAAHLWVLIGTLLIYSVYALSAFVFDVVPTSGKWSLLPIALLMLPLYGAHAARNGVIKGLGYPAMAELPNSTLQPILTLIIVAVVAFNWGLSPESVISIQVASTVFVFILATFIFLKVRPREAHSVRAEYNIREWRQALSPFILLALFGTFNAQLGLLALGFFSTDEQVAALRVAERGAQFVNLSLTVVNLIISPYIVRAYRSGDTQQLQKLSKQSARGALLLALPIGLVLIVFGAELLKLLFGEEYAVLSYTPLVILTLGQIANVFFGSVGFLLAMTGHEKHSFKAQITAIMISATLCILLIPNYGAIGAATAVASSIVVWNSILAYFVFRKLKIKPSAW